MRVRRLPPDPPSKTKTSAKPKRVRKHQISQAEQARLAKLDADVLDYKSRGYTRAMIAKELGVDVVTVHRAWERSFSEYIIDHRKLRDEKFAEILAGHERMIREWSDKKGARAATLVLRARREISRMCGHGNTLEVEHTGAAGGPIVTVNATPMEAARLLRQQFLSNKVAMAADDGSTTH